MREVGRRVARRHDGVVEPDVGESGCLELRDVDVGGGLVGGERVPRLVEPRSPRGTRSCAKPWLNASDAWSFSTTSRGERLAGVDVAGVRVEDLGPVDPHLVDLAGELDEVAEDVRAREVRVGDRREQAVQGVAELVEERRDLVEREERRHAGRGLGHVEVVDDDRLACRAGATARRSSSSTRRRAWCRACRGRG